jgi:murein DD-endopeptidase MepM/ murein hydrolase activator NlpD
VPKRTPYAGRHRGRHRQVVERPQRGLALPGAAAAALTLTATGAAVVPGLANSTAAATEPQATPDPSPRTVSAEPTNARQHAQETRTELAAAEIAQIAADARAEARQRASRTAERRKLAQRKQQAEARVHRYVLPVTAYRLSSRFGHRASPGGIGSTNHKGLDFAAPVGTRIDSISSGTVVFAGQQSGYGNKVEIRHWDGTVSWYAHMSQIDVAVGDQVAPGQKVGEIGTTGHSTGPHLHLEIHVPVGTHLSTASRPTPPIDPLTFLAKRGVDVVAKKVAGI